MARSSDLASPRDPIRLVRIGESGLRWGLQETSGSGDDGPSPRVRPSRVFIGSGDLIHRSRQAGWGLACCWSARLSRRPASPIRTRRMGSGQSCGRTVATNLQVCRSNNRIWRSDSLVDRSGGFLDTTGQRPIPRPCVAVKCGQALRNASDPTDLVSVVKEVCG